MFTPMTLLELQQLACSPPPPLVLILSMLPLIVRHSHLRIDELDVQKSDRHVWSDVTALDGRRMHGT